MLRLMSRDLFKASTRPGREAGVRECFGIVFRERGAVEVVLEVLEGEGVLKRGGGGEVLVTRRERRGKRGR